MLTKAAVPAPATDGRPFGPALDQRFLYPSRSHTRAVDEVRQALRRRDGLIVVTGDAGTGKTLLCRTLLHEMEEAAFVSIVLDSRVEEEDLMAHILTDFGVTRADLPIPAHVRRRALTAALQRFLRELIPVNGYAVIIVDEAQHLNPVVLEQLRLLMNFETDEAKLLQVVLVGQRDLERRLREPDMQALDQRVARRCEMQPLSRFEVKRYIERRLTTAQQIAGSWRGTFTPAAARAVAAVSGGVPRVVNRVCDLALEIGEQRQTRVIDAGIVRAAARRLNVSAGAREWPWKTPAAAAAAFTLVAGAAMASWGPFSAGRAEAGAANGPGLSVVGAGSSVVGAGFPGLSKVEGSRPDASSVVRTVLTPSSSTLAESSGTLALSTGINVQVGSFKSADRAAAVAAQVKALGLPSFTRVRDGQWHQVTVGPYVTDDEALVARRGLEAHGFTGIRSIVETAGPSDSRRPGADARVLLLPSAERMSLVLQLAEEPKKVVTRVVDGSTLEIDLGPVVAQHPAERLNAPAGVAVIAHVALENVASGREALVRVRVGLQGASRNDVRVVGRRVYLDFTPALAGRLKPAPTDAGRLEPAPTDAGRPESALTAAGRLQPALTAAGRLQPAASGDVGAGFSRPAPDYDDAIAPVMSRLKELEPFLLSATSAPTPQVLTAIAQVLADLQASLRAIDVPPAAAAAHARLVVAVAEARLSVAQDFSGDRATQARQAIALWMAAAERKES